MKFTEHLTGRVQTTDQWKEDHARCLGPDEDFTTESYDPAGTWVFVVCLCGAKHLVNLDEISGRPEPTN